MLWHNNGFYLWMDNKRNDNVVDRMTEIFVVLHDNSDELVAIFWKEEDYNEYMEEHSIFSDLTGRRVIL